MNLARIPAADPCLGASGSNADDRAPGKDLVEVLDGLLPHAHTPLALIVPDARGIAGSVKSQAAVATVEQLPGDPSGAQRVFRIAEGNRRVTCAEPHRLLGLLSGPVLTRRSLASRFP